MALALIKTAAGHSEREYLYISFVEHFTYYLVNICSVNQLYIPLRFKEGRGRGYLAILSHEYMAEYQHCISFCFDFQ